MSAIFFIELTYRQRLRRRLVLRQMRENMLRQTLQVRITSNTQKILLIGQNDVCYDIM